MSVFKEDVMNKVIKKLFAAFAAIAVALPAAVMPQVRAMSNPYSTPSWNPGSTPHPRVMLTSADIPRIQENLDDYMQSGPAAYYFRYVLNNSSLRTGSVSLSSSVSSSTGTNSNYRIEGEIEIFALFYALYANDPTYGEEAETCAEVAITRMQEYLNAFKYNKSYGLAYRSIGCVVLHASEVFDWCYNYSGFTQAKKDTMISSIETLAKKLDVWNSSANSPTNEGAITSHGSENQILRDLLAFGIATAGHTTASGNSRNDIYNAVMGRIQAEYIEPRNDIYRSSTIHQGSEYGWYRFYYDLYAEKLYETAATQSSRPPKTLFDTDLMKEVCYGMIYSRRADGRYFTEGDNKHSDYYYYNNFNRQTPKLAGDLFGDEYFKGEYRRTTGSEGTAWNMSSNVFGYNQSFCDDRSFNAVLWLIMNDPSVPFTTDRRGLPKSRYFGSPIGKIYATTNRVYQQARDDVFNIDSVSCEMKIGERYSSNHDHLDAGTFQLFYNGLLTGDYGAEGDYGSDFDINYYKRTVAHNAITINDNNVGFTFGTGGMLYNDGGQIGGPELNIISRWQNNAPYKRASVVNHAIAEDNSYSYIKGDITPAYGSKAAEVARSMAFLPVSTSRAVMVVYDKVKSSGDYAKRFLLHLASEPDVTNNKIVSDNTNTTEYTNGSVTYSGRLTVNTLLPADAAISKRTAGYVSASGKTFSPDKPDSKYEPEWGYVEIAPKSTTDNTAYFLNVLTVSEAGVEMTDAELINTQSDIFVGAKTGLDQVVMFANTGVGSLPATKTGGSFTIDSGKDLTLFVFGLAEGEWAVKRNGVIIAAESVTAEGGALSVEGIDAGTYTIARDSSAQPVVASYESGNVFDGVWQDSSGNGLDITFTPGDDMGSTMDGGLFVEGSNGGLKMPEELTDTVNGDKFSLEFEVSELNITNNNRCASLFGNVREGFSVYKIIGADRIYIKLPGSNTILTRPHMSVDEVIGHHNVITVDKSDEQRLKWYIDGECVTSYPFTLNDPIPALTLMPEPGNSAVYKMIRIYDVALTDANAKQISSE